MKRRCKIQIYWVQKSRGKESLYSVCVLSSLKRYFSTPSSTTNSFYTLPGNIFTSPMPEYGVSLGSSSELREIMLNTAQHLLTMPQGGKLNTSSSFIFDHIPQRDSIHSHRDRENDQGYMRGQSGKIRGRDRMDFLLSSDKRFMDEVGNAASNPSETEFLHGLIPGYKECETEDADSYHTLPDPYLLAHEFIVDLSRDWCLLCDESVQNKWKEHSNLGKHRVSYQIYQLFLALYPHHRVEDVVKRWSYKLLGGYPVTPSDVRENQRSCDSEGKPTSSSLQKNVSTVSRFTLISALLYPSDLTKTANDMRKVIIFLRKHSVLRISLRVDHERHEFDRLEWIGDLVMYEMIYDLFSELFGSEHINIQSQIIGALTRNEGFDLAYQLLQLDEVICASSFTSTYPRADIFEAIIGELYLFAQNCELDIGYGNFCVAQTRKMETLRRLARHCQYTMGILYVILYIKKRLMKSFTLLEKAFSVMETEGKRLRRSPFATAEDERQAQIRRTLKFLRDPSNTIFEPEGSKTLFSQKSLQSKLYTHILQKEPYLSRYVTYPECTSSCIQVRGLEEDQPKTRDSNESDSPVVQKFHFLQRQTSVARIRSSSQMAEATKISPKRGSEDSPIDVRHEGPPVEKKYQTKEQKSTESPFLMGESIQFSSTVPPNASIETSLHPVDVQPGIEDKPSKYLSKREGWGERVDASDLVENKKKGPLNGLDTFVAPLLPFSRCPKASSATFCEENQKFLPTFLSLDLNDFSNQTPPRTILPCITEEPTPMDEAPDRGGAGDHGIY